MMQTVQQPNVRAYLDHYCRRGGCAGECIIRAADCNKGVRTSEPSSLRAHIDFDLVRGGRDRLIDRLALLGAAGDHVAQDPLYKHLVPEIDRRRITRQRRDHVAARRVVV
jgi:hypothetical protein